MQQQQEGSGWNSLPFDSCGLCRTPAKLKSTGEDCVVFCQTTAGELRGLLLFLVFGHWSNSAAVHLASHGHSHWFPWHQCLCVRLLKRVEKKDLWFSLPALPISNAHCSITKGKIDLQLSSSAPIHFDGWDQPPTRPSLCPLQKSRQCLFGAGDKSVGMTEHSMLLIHQTLLWSCLDKHREKYCQFSTEFQNLLHFY